MSDNNSKRPVPLSMVINLVLIVAVIVLYIFYFNTRGETADEPAVKTNKTSDLSVAKGPTLAFVNTDVLLQQYDLVDKLMKQLEAESKKKDADLSSRQKELENEAAYFQESMQKNQLNEQSAQRIYDQLMIKQEEIYSLQEQYASELAQKEFEMNIILLDSVRNYLQRLNIDNKYDYILNYNATGSILIAKDTFDITDKVLKGLNKEYNAKYGSK